MPRRGSRNGPKCDAPTKLRKIALAIHVDHEDGPRLVVLGQTCRLCVACEILIAHQNEVEAFISASGVGGTTPAPEYMVLGTVEGRTWGQGLQGGMRLDDVRAHMSDFRRYLRVEVEPAGWYPRHAG